MSDADLNKYKTLELEESLLSSKINRSFVYLDPVQEARTMSAKQAARERYAVVMEELNELRSRL